MRAGFCATLLVGRLLAEGAGAATKLTVAGSIQTNGIFAPSVSGCF